MVSRASDETCRFEAALNRLVGVGVDADSMHHNERGSNTDAWLHMHSRRPRSPGSQMPPSWGGSPHSTHHRQQAGKGSSRGLEQRVANQSHYHGKQEATAAITSSPHHRSHYRSSEREWQSHQSHSNYHLYAQEQQHYTRYYADDEPSFYEEDYQYQRNAYDRDINRWSSCSKYSSDRGHGHGAATGSDDKAIQRRRAREQRDQEERHRRWVQQAKVKEEQEKEFRHYEQTQRVRKEEQERARKEQERAEAERKQRRQHAVNRAEYEKKIAELVRPAGIPKPPPPLHEAQRLPSNTYPHWTEIAAAAAAATAIKGSEHPSESSTKVSWEPPYSYWSSTSEEQTVGKPLHLCKTSSSHSDLEKKLSSHHSSSSPKKLPPSSAHLKSSGHSSAKDSSRVGAFAEKPTPVCLVEIEPDFSLPLRGSAETLRAVEMGCVLPTLCMACSASLIVKDDCDYVICPSCRVVCAVDGGLGTMQFVGLGMLL